MSKYSGKCDVYDTFWDRSDEYINNSKFYIYCNGRDHKLDIHNHFDLMPYYPFLLGSGGFGKDDCTAYIASDSFVDKEEKEFLEYDLHQVIRIYNRCKRNKEEFNPENVYDELNFFNEDNKILREIINRVAEKGSKADVDGLHRNMQEYYRTLLYEDMVDAGYDELKAYRWVFKEFMYFNNDEPKRRLYRS